MSKWLGRIRGAIGMGLTWAVAWALVGLLIGVSSILLPGLPWNSFFAFFDAPLPTLAVPGFFGGALFSIVLSIAGRRRRFDELSLPRFTAWGSLGGVLLSLVPATMVAVGLANFNAGRSVWQITAVISGPLTLLSAASAAGSLLLARMGQKRERRKARASVVEASLSHGGTSPLLSGTDKSPEDLQARRNEERQHAAPARGRQD
jgi:hypothetical protein